MSKTDAIPPRSPMVGRGDEFGSGVAAGDMKPATLPMSGDAVVDGFVARYHRVQAVSVYGGFPAIPRIDLVQGGDSSGQGPFVARKMAVATGLDDLR
jgi:hypothetical protein